MRQNASFNRKPKLGVVRSAKQKGAVMIVALMLLLVMTILAVSGVGNSVLEQRMSGNYYQSATAFQAAEYGLRIAEQWLTSTVDTPSEIDDWFGGSGYTNGLYTTQVITAPNDVEVCRGAINCLHDPRDGAEWCAGGAGCSLPKSFVTLGDTLHGQTLATLGSTDPDHEQYMVPRQPQFIIEYLGQADGPGAAPNVDISNVGIDAPYAAFRITVIGWGKDGVTRHVLQSHILSLI